MKNINQKETLNNIKEYLDKGSVLYGFEEVTFYGIDFETGKWAKPKKILRPIYK